MMTAPRNCFPAEKSASDCRKHFGMEEEMEFYFAPLEGITGYVYRNAFHETFDCGISKYFMPFIAMNRNGLTKSRELEDLNAEHNRGMKVVPQLLGNNGKEAVFYLHRLKEMGYREVNLNLGCPYQTVVSKGKGAGLLQDTDKLNRFLKEVFEEADIAVSVKTRIGMERPEEFEEILEIYNLYPLSELIIHPRVREDFYGNHPDMEVFGMAVAKSRAPLCYNGDLFTVEDYHTFTAAFPDIQRVMLGRGLIANPGLLSEILTGKAADKEMLLGFHDKIFEDYQRIMSGDTNTLFKMKELWNYMQFLFDDSQKHIKRIRKARNGAEYRSAVSTLFAECPLRVYGRNRNEN